jgi:hypothetical protein
MRQGLNGRTPRRAECGYYPIMPRQLSLALHHRVSDLDVEACDACVRRLQPTR